MKKIIILILLSLLNCNRDTFDTEQTERNRIECRDSKLLVIATYNEMQNNESFRNANGLLALVISISDAQCKKYNENKALKF